MLSNPRLVLVVGALVACEAHIARAGEVTGAVYVDADGDGLLSPGDPAVPGAAVFWETGPSAVTGAGGSYSLEAPDRAGIVWVSVPDGYRPGPVWASVDATGGAVVDLGLTPADPDADAGSFVVASDTHTGLELVSQGDVTSAIDQLSRLWPPPAFFTITGDLTQANRPDEMAAIAEATAGAGLPFVPVPGNHDWYDGGATYRAHFGPPSHSFGAGGTHFVVINDAIPVPDRIDFIDEDLAHVDAGTRVVVFTHAPPPDDLVEALEDRGADYLFTGHLHSNRVLQHDVLVEYNTQGLAMGGIDTTPAGFRVVTTAADGSLDATHRTTVGPPLVELVHPRPGARAEGCPVELIVAAEVGASAPEVRASSGGEVVTLERTGGGWTYTGELASICRTGEHAIEIEAVTAAGDRVAESYTVEVTGGRRYTRLATADWPQLQGGPDHRGVAPGELVPPLEPLWATAVDGNLHGGSPIVSGDLVLVPLADFGDGSRGGVVALELMTGREVWRYRAGAGVRSAPAVSGQTAVLAGLDGMVHAVDLATGALRWTYQIAPDAEPQSRNLYAAPVAAGDLVFAGNKRELVALDLETGAPLWSRTPGDKGFFGSYVTPAVTEDLVVATFAMGGLGLMAWDAQLGELAWQTPGAISTGAMASPIADAGTVYVVDWQARLSSLDLYSGQVYWTTALAEDGFPWGYGVTATPALAGGMLYVPGHHGALYAVDAESGLVQWTMPASTGRIRTAHYRGSSARSFAASPVVAGSLLWAGGVDGILRAVDPTSGDEVWSDYLGAPITMAPAPAGDILIVATYDGTVRALVAERDLAVSPPPQARVPEASCGCGTKKPSSGSGLVLILVAAALWLPCRARRAGPPALDQAVSTSRASSARSSTSTTVSSSRTSPSDISSR